MNRRDTLTLAAAGLSAPLSLATAATDAGGARVLRGSFPIAETGFDPAQVSVHAEEGRTGYTARCAQGHVFSGALPG